MSQFGSLYWVLNKEKRNTQHKTLFIKRHANIGNVFFSYKRQLQVLPQQFIELREKYNNNKGSNDTEA